MTEKSIISLLSETCTTLDHLKMHDAHAESYERAQERTALVLQAAQRLHAALQRLRAASLLLKVVAPDCHLASLWSRTCADLQKGMPRDFRAPAAAIIEGHLDLLRLIEYTACSAAVAEERGDQIADHLARLMQESSRDDGAHPSAVYRAWIEEALSDLVRKKNADDAHDMWQMLLRRCGEAP